MKMSYGASCVREASLALSMLKDGEGADAAVSHLEVTIAVNIRHSLVLSAGCTETCLHLFSSNTMHFIGVSRVGRKLHPHLTSTLSTHKSLTSLSISRPRNYVTIRESSRVLLCLHGFCSVGYCSLRSMYACLLEKKPALPEGFSLQNFCQYPNGTVIMGIM
jgi:hypothetical protein